MMSAFAERSSEIRVRTMWWARNAVCALVVAVVVVLGLMGGVAWASFGVERGSFTTEARESDGTLDTRAGSHPYEYIVSFNLNVNGTTREVEGDLRDALVNLPAGMVGNPLAVPRCSRQEFEGVTAFCPGDTQVGTAEAKLAEGGAEAFAPVFNLVPPVGVPAQLAFSADGFTGILDAAVRTGAGYGVQVSDYNVPIAVQSVTVRVWGMPPEKSHDSERQCVTEANGIKHAVSPCSSDVAPRPFLTLPSSCAGPLSSTLAVDSLEMPGVFVTEGADSLGANGQPVDLFGCEALPFNPAFVLHPEGVGVEEPTGLNVELKIPQPESPEGLAEADLRDAEVVLPEGVTVNPSAANGLLGCPLTGSEGINLSSPEPAGCPKASKIGTVSVKTPLLEEELAGSVFVAAQGNLVGNGENPFGSLLAIYVVAEGDGVVAKIPGKIELQEGTGRLAAKFGEDPITHEDGLPQLPYSDLRMSFFGGARAALVTPGQCGSYTTKTSLTPWSGTPAVVSASSFTISQNCGGEGFAPAFDAGTVDPQAAAYTPFTEAFARNDREQRLAHIEQTLPVGLLAKIAAVELCGESEANAGACPEGSQIGTVTVAVGPGADPLTVDGHMYLTGPYEDAPFGMVVEVPAIAGPFDLDENGRPVTVRGAIRINPETAQATIVTDSFPTMLQGVPLDVRSVRVAVDHPNFIFNPTNCTPQSVAGTIVSSAGANVGVASPFAAANCAALPFKPSFTASTQAQTSKAGGASLTVRVAEKPGEANIHKVDLQIPKILPARLTTLQKACTEAQFNANPAGCPEGSVIATATAHTPVLRVPLTGPGYLVSHGNAAFPDVEFVLQADERGGDVKIVLDGKTDIKDGITYSRFESVPDAPVETFETVLPQGPHSALTANLPEDKKYNLCGQNITIPTVITGQSGATIEQTTHVAIEGCAQVKAAKAKKKLTLAQQLQHALAKCRSRYKHVKGKRAHCEARAHTHYTTLALTTCRNEHKHNRKQRVACEAMAHKRYGSKH
jgi:hypothetical protein